MIYSKEKLDEVIGTSRALRHQSRELRQKAKELMDSRKEKILLMGELIKSLRIWEQ